MKLSLLLLAALAACGASHESGLPSARAMQIAGGRDHACALTTDGGVRCWGYDISGQLGNGVDLTDTSIDSDADQRYLPLQVIGLDSGVSMIATTGTADFTCALAGGAVKCWGDNANGQLGDGTLHSSSVPVDVIGISDATAIAVGGDHACAIVGGGAVKCWGRNDSSQLGDGTGGPEDTDHNKVPMPVAVAGLTGVAQVALGSTHSCARIGTAVSCWGDNIAGECGFDDQTWTVVAPTAVAGLTDVAQLVAGAEDTCAITAGGAAKCWGNNRENELGNGMDGFTFDQSDTPMGVVGIDSGATSLFVNNTYSAAAVGGAAKVWGQYTAATDPSPVDGPALPEPATSIVGGGDGGYACILAASGAVYCWGNNDAGVVGYYDPDSGVHEEPEPLGISSLD